MQWYDCTTTAKVCTSDTTIPRNQTTCLHVERDVKQNILRMGVIRYPMAQHG
jgi:hypothetical protein